MSRGIPDRLDRIEVMLEKLITVQSNQQTSIDKLIEGQLAMQVLQGQLVEQTMQLKRAVDSLMSKDGESR